ncbi:MAG: GyrI-like domain-containing protein [Haliscomenobacter sp.]|nr:GyrI-like domain-containing protein [Haliscomenobacter sp.]MBK9487732.1 GyrI-like domain-containing protein [Haliscomenobacter sp.]
MYPKIETLPSKKLIGKRLKMSFLNDITAELWGSFMPYRKDILHKIGIDLYSMQIFESPPSFKTDATFQKWAAVEVSSFEVVPEGMEAHILAGGLYAVFLHQGPASAFQKTFQFIFDEWLPNSEYTLDHREHFELLGPKYKNNDPSSEEEIWIPIKRRNPA